MTDMSSLRAREYPWAVRGEQIFLNHASTGPLPQRAVDALNEATALRARPWLFSAEMQFGTLAKGRAACARLIGAHADEIALMVNTTYGLNLAARALPFEPGDVVITSDREYPSNIYPWMELEVARGIELVRIPCDGILPDEAAILAALDRPRVRCVVLSWVSFATGYRIDLERIGKACRERGIWFVVDGMQGIGAIDLDVRTSNVDIIACGGQKWLLSPWGTGFVWLRPDLVQSLRPVDVSWMSTVVTDDFRRLTDYDFTYRPNARKFEVITLPYQDFVGLNASLDLFLDERHCSGDSFTDGPRDLCLRRNREVAADVLEQRPVGLGKVERVAREALHRLLALLENGTAIFEVKLRSHVRIDQVTNGSIDGSRVLIHAGLKLGGVFLDHSISSSH